MREITKKTQGTVATTTTTTTTTSKEMLFYNRKKVLGNQPHASSCLLAFPDFQVSIFHTVGPIFIETKVL